ncbi:MAG: InlB B-repeat-containing protein [Clostridia bacterium]|nr:InlB B-repeat-containing protein [Clostridia bacterium]
MKKLLAVLMSVLLLCGTFPLSVFAASGDVYTIVYHLDGGTNALKNPGAYTTTDTIVLKDATKDGYTFDGWYLDAAKTRRIYEITNQIGDLALYAKFIPNRYMATFIDYGATQSSTLTVLLDDDQGNTKEVQLNIGDSFNPYKYWIPEKKNYVFMGWYKKAGGEVGNLSITEDTTLIARWQQAEPHGPDKTATILGGNTTYVKNQGDYNYKTEFGSYLIDSSAADGYGKYLFVYINGQCTEIKYTLTNTEWDHGCSIIDVTGNGTIASIGPWKTETKTGTYKVTPGTLLRLCLNGGPGVGSGTIQLSIGKTKDITIETAHERTVEHVFDSAMQPPTVSREGYTFAGWHDEQGNPMTDTWQYLEDQTFSAQWDPLSYNIRYELDGGVNHPSNPSSYIFTDFVTLQPASKAGYTFQGWYTDPDFNNPITNIRNQTENYTLYAKFEPNRYLLTLDTIDGTFSPKMTFISDGAVIKTIYLSEQDSLAPWHPAAKEGYLFAGWCYDEAGTRWFSFHDTLTDDVTLYAQWIPCAENVVNVETVEDIPVTIDGTKEHLYAFIPLTHGYITVTSESSQMDLSGSLYDAVYWPIVSSDDISDNDLDFSYTCEVFAGETYYIAVKGNTALTKGEANLHIDWKDDGHVLTGSTYTHHQLTVSYDAPFTLPDKLVREGYVFMGWYDEHGNQITDGVWKFTTDKSLLAMWRIATPHTITFKDAQGNVLSSQVYYYGDEIAAPALPTKAPDETYRYTAHWSNDYTGVCTGDAVYTPVFDPVYIDYTVTFKNWDGTILSTATYHYGDTVAVPEIPAREEDSLYTYTFAGWDTAVVACNGNAVYTATFTAQHEHRYVVTDTFAPTCAEDGYSTHTCRCGDAYNEVIPATDNHVYNNACDTDCNACGAVRDVEPHAYVGTIVISATCGANGVKTYTCSICGDSYNEVIPATGHHVYNNACDTDCNACGTYREVEPHAYVGTVVRPATCGTDGLTVYTCSICGDSYNETIPATGNHTYDNACDADCNACGAERDVEPHAYVGTEVISPSCGTDGLTVYTCSICGDSYNETIPATGDHTYNSDYDPDCDVCGAVREVISFIPGDADGNGKINNRDLGLLQKFLNGTDVDINFYALDMDGNNKINNRDLGLLQKFLNR